MNLPLRDLTADAFAEYGEVIAQPSGDADALGPGWTWWGQTALLPRQDRPYAVGYLRLEPGPLAFDWAENHRQSVEVIIPVGGECAVYVGPAGREAPPWDRFAAFRVREGQAVILRPGVWHGAPLALDRPMTALVLLREGTGAEDVYKATTDHPVTIVRDAS